jgi:hypothetical protein
VAPIFRDEEREESAGVDEDAPHTSSSE